MPAAWGLPSSASQDLAASPKGEALEQQGAWALEDSLSDCETENGDLAGPLPCYDHLDRILGDEVDEDLPLASSSRLTPSPSRSLAARLAQDCRALHAAAVGTFGVGGRAPRVLCVSRRYLRKNKYVGIVGEYHLELVQDYGGVPVVLPRTAATLEHLAEYLPMDGLIVAEGNDISDEVLRRYGCAVPPRLDAEGAAKYASDTEFDVAKDELEFALMRFALAVGCPILGLCRGSQMINVLRGGTLIGDIATEVGDKVVHLRDSSDPTYDSFRHPINVLPNTPLAEWFGDSLGASMELQVNSYHHQGVKHLGSQLLPMAYAPDGVLEGFYDANYEPAAGRFVMGLQFHPERMLDDYPGCSRVYASFLQACASFKAKQDRLQ